MFPTFRRAGSSHGLRSKPKLEISRIWVSEEERNAAQLSRRNIQNSLDEFHQNGFVILENAVGRHSIEHVHHRMLQDFGKYRKSSSIRWNQGQNSGNISQPPPSLPEYLHEDIWANRLGVDIMKNIIGLSSLSQRPTSLYPDQQVGRQSTVIITVIILTSPFSWRSISTFMMSTRTTAPQNSGLAPTKATLKMITVRQQQVGLSKKSSRLGRRCLHQYSQPSLRGH